MKKSPRPKALWTRVAGSVPITAPAKEPQPRKLRKPIQKRTPKRSKEDRQYTENVLQWWNAKFRDGAKCPVTNFKLAPWNIQCHHIYGRRGKLLNWQPGWLAVSCIGHRWIHDHPDEARKRGWLAPVGQWNNQKLMEENK